MARDRRTLAWGKKKDGPSGPVLPSSEFPSGTGFWVKVCRTQPLDSSLSAPSNRPEKDPYPPGWGFFHISSSVFPLANVMRTPSASDWQTEEVVPRFFSSFVISTGILFLFKIPTFYLAWRKGRKKTIRRFLMAGIAVGLVVAVISATSERLVEQCEAVNYLGCVDYGSAGMRLTIMVAFIIVSWVKAAILFNE